MTERMYIVVFDMLTTPLTVRVRRLLQAHGDVFRRWWNHLPFAFLVVSDKSAEEITELVHRHMQDARFLVAEIDIGNSNGVLAGRSWDWILERENELPRFESA